jgi:hypothetical protein
MRRRRVTARDNMVFLGPPGTGKPRPGAGEVDFAIALWLGVPT